MLIRQMSVGDVESIACIEEAAFSPWSRKQIAAELTRPTGYAFVAVTSTGDVQGWCCGLLASCDAELLKIAVNSSKRRRGVATVLIENLCFLLAARGGEHIFIEVRACNCSARKLYVKLGFHETGIRKNYYKNPLDDAVIFVRKLTKDIG